MLFVYDSTTDHALVRMIDLPKVGSAGAGADGKPVELDHRSAWLPTNREDGYLTGLDQMVTILEELGAEGASSCVAA